MTYRYVCVPVCVCVHVVYLYMVVYTLTLANRIAVGDFPTTFNAN